MFRFIFLFVAGLLSFGMPVAAQESSVNTRGIDKVDPRYRSQIQTNPGPILQSVLDEFFKLAVDDVVTGEILWQQHNDRVEQFRAGLTSGYLRYDLDEDGTLSAMEMSRGTPGLSDGVSARLQAQRFLYDADADGSLGPDEIARAVEAELAKHNRDRPRGERLLQFDFNDDGAVTQPEIIAVFEALRRSAPKEPVSREQQLEDARQAAFEREMAELRQSLEGTGLPEICAYPRKSEAATVRWLTAIHGQALSPVAISGIFAGTTVGRLHVEEGAGPFYLIVGSHKSMIWHFTGEVSQIERVVTHDGNAVLGVPREKVHFAQSGFCAPGPSDYPMDAVRRLFGSSIRVAFEQPEIRGSDLRRFGALTFPLLQPVIGALKVTGVKEPVVRNRRIFEIVNGEPKPLDPEEAARRQLQFNLEKQFPYGVAEIDEDALVLQGTAQRYDPLPAQAGLLQMLERGDLRGEGPDRLVITRPIRSLPAVPEMTGDLVPANRFYVDTGVILDLDQGNLAAFGYHDAGTAGCPIGIACGIQPPRQ